LFDRWAISCYNVLFTFWPPIVIGWFERPCEDKRMLEKPQLYSTSQLSSKFNGVVFWKMFVNSIVHSFLIFFLTYACYSDLDWSSGGFGGPSGGMAMETLSPQGQVGGYLYIGKYRRNTKLLRNKANVLRSTEGFCTGYYTHCTCNRKCV